MAWLIELGAFALPFLLYALWLRVGGRRMEPSRATLSLAAVGIACMLAGALYYGLSRSLERGERYVPAQFEGGRIRR
ncbi:MAG TPA: hypothetical protein VEY31_14770 [Roseococcus sp.]|jgi:hypothetical protein|nr:hypothetical protein [Roseococcus sp.]